VDATVRALMALARAKAAKQPDRDDDALVALLTAWFASQPAIAATALPDDLVAALVARGFTQRAAIEAGELGSDPTMAGRSRYGAPAVKPNMTTQRRVATEEPELRARYVVAAAERLTDADDYDVALAREKTYRDQHVAAGRNRRKAARELDRVAATSKTGWLVWRCGDHPEPECKALNNRIFTVDNPPGIPGAMHPNCKCWSEPYGGFVPV